MTTFDGWTMEVRDGHSGRPISDRIAVYISVDQDGHMSFDQDVAVKVREKSDRPFVWLFRDGTEWMGFRVSGWFYKVGVVKGDTVFLKAGRFTVDV